MVTLSRYLKVYGRVLSERMDILRKDLKEKRKIDRSVRSYIPPKSIEELRKLVGEDTLFRKAENRRKTIRHQIWKFDKSFAFFLEKDGDLRSLVKSADKVPVMGWGYKTFISELYNSYRRFAVRLKAMSKELLSVYEKEAEVLSKDYGGREMANDYARLVQQENRLILSIKKDLANITRWQKKLYLFLKRVPGEHFTQEHGIFIIVSILGAALTGFSYSMMDTEPSAGLLMSIGLSASVTLNAVLMGGLTMNFLKDFRRVFS